MKKLLLTLIVSLAFCGSIFAQYESHWPGFYDPAFAFQKGFVAAIMIDGNIVSTDDEGWDALEVAFFYLKSDGTEECRGNQNYLFDAPAEYGDPYPTFDGVPVYYNTEGEPLYIKMYDHLNDIEYNECTMLYLGEEIELISGEEHYEGWDDPDNPIFLSFTTPETTCYPLDILGYGENEGGYYLIASPIGDIDDATTVENLIQDDGYDFYYFDQTQDLEWINYKAEGFGLTAGKGYLYASAGDVQLKFCGEAYNGEATFPLIYDESAELPGWNLVGNPFATEASIDKEEFYTMNEDGSELMEASGEIQPMNGVFVLAEAEGESVTFTKFLKGEKSQRLALNLSNGRYLIDRAVVRFDQGSILPKFQLNQNSTKVFIQKDNKDYAVVNAEQFGEMPVSFKAAKNGAYTLSFSSENTQFNYLHLVDNLTGADVDLLVNPSYTFDATISDYASRFKLVFATGNDNNDSFAFYNNGNIVVNNSGDATLNIVDVLGRTISSRNINGSENVSINAKAGVYMIQLIQGDNVKTQKIVVE